MCLHKYIIPVSRHLDMVRRSIRQLPALCDQAIQVTGQIEKIDLTNIINNYHFYNFPNKLNCQWNINIILCSVRLSQQMKSTPLKWR